MIILPRKEKGNISITIQRIRHMNIKIDKESFFIFDLDDTLFREVDFLRSAYKQIAKMISEQDAHSIYEEMFGLYKKKENVFEWVLSKYGNKIPELTKETLLETYRNHLPEINLSEDIRMFLDRVHSEGAGMGLITDGRSITQRNKLKALRILDYFNDLIISEEFGTEKPNPLNFLYFEKKYPGKKFYFFGDNTIKDFVIPVKLGWTSICIMDAGENIHRQNIDSLAKGIYLVNSFKEIVLI